MRRAWLILLALCGCSDDAAAPVASEPTVWPEGFPAPAIPEDNPVTADKAELGRHLFYDRRLSGNGTQSCAGCHEPQKAMSDGLALPLGSTGQTLPRSAMSLFNVAYLPTLTWANPNLTTLEQQALVPMFAEAPVELGMTGHEDEILGRLRAEPRYAGLFARAFPGDADPFTLDRVVKAIATFERTLVSSNAPYDRYNRGETAALSEAAKRGKDLFFSEVLECYHCHAGLNLTTAFRAAGSRSTVRSFENTGLYNLDGKGSYPVPNVGLFEFTSKPSDMGKFRVPPLRNVELTAPYMHDGSIATLDEVLDFYAAGGRHITEGPSVGDGRANPYKNPLVRGFVISADEKADVVAFLKSFTDTSVLTDPRWQDPWATPP